MPCCLSAPLIFVFVRVLPPSYDIRPWPWCTVCTRSPNHDTFCGPNLTTVCVAFFHTGERAEGFTQPRAANLPNYQRLGTRLDQSEGGAEGVGVREEGYAAVGCKQQVQTRARRACVHGNGDDRAARVLRPER